MVTAAARPPRAATPLCLAAEVDLRGDAHPGCRSWMPRNSIITNSGGSASSAGGAAARGPVTETSSPIGVVVPAWLSKANHRIAVSRALCAATAAAATLVNVSVPSRDRAKSWSGSTPFSQRLQNLVLAGDQGLREVGVRFRIGELGALHRRPDQVIVERRQQPCRPERIVGPHVVERAVRVVRLPALRGEVRGLEAADRGKVRVCTLIHGRT